MGRLISRRRNCILFLCAAMLAISARAAADTLVLKNGRRSAALSVVEEGDKVKYVTSAGELSLPKSIVDHIEKGGAGGLAGTAGTAAANLAIAPPAMQPGDWGGSEEIEHAAVHDGAIDRDTSRSWSKRRARAPSGPASALQLRTMPRRGSSCHAATWGMRSPMPARLRT